MPTSRPVAALCALARSMTSWNVGTASGCAALGAKPGYAVPAVGPEGCTVSLLISASVKSATL